MLVNMFKLHSHVTVGMMSLRTHKAHCADMRNNLYSDGVVRMWIKLGVSREKKTLCCARSKTCSFQLCCLCDIN